jgi:hypothetical protein
LGLLRRELQISRERDQELRVFAADGVGKNRSRRERSFDFSQATKMGREDTRIISRCAAVLELPNYLMINSLRFVFIRAIRGCFPISVNLRQKFF